MPGRGAVRAGWSALRQVLRVWGIEEPNHDDVVVGQGFPGTSPGNHISARAQEFTTGEANCVDARVALLAIHMVVSLLRHNHIPSHRSLWSRRETAGVDWGQLDKSQVDNLFFTRVPMLKT